ARPGRGRRPALRLAHRLGRRSVVSRVDRVGGVPQGARRRRQDHADAARSAEIPGLARGADAAALNANAAEEEWLWGWDATPGIVSVWAEPDGRAFVWRRLPGSRTLVREVERFRPWLLLATLDDLAHLGPRLRPERDGLVAPDGVTYREL